MASEIREVFEGMADLVEYKNKKYGNSAIAPIRVFSKATPEEGIFVRLDDKLSRINNAGELRKNDVSDLMGYLALLCVKRGWTDFREFMD